MLQGDLATNFMARVHRTTQAILPRLDIGSVQEEVGGGWSADVESERSVRADGHARGHGYASVDVCSAGVELLQLTRLVSIDSTALVDLEEYLAKVHALHTLTTQRRTDWRTGGCLASSDDELDKLVSLQN